MFFPELDTLIFQFFSCTGDFGDFFIFSPVLGTLIFFMTFPLLGTFDFYMSSCVLKTVTFNKFPSLVIELTFPILKILISRFSLCWWLVTLSFHFHLSSFFIRFRRYDVIDYPLKKYMFDLLI